MNSLFWLLILVIFAINIIIGLPIRILKYIKLKNKSHDNSSKPSKKNHFNIKNEIIDVDYIEL